ncbi:hypothetical protein PQR27_25450 [Paraburkholderia fungorum]
MLSMVALTTATYGCKRVDNGNKDTMSAGSSGVMSNTAGVNGTPGDSDAAKRAEAAAGTAASSTSPASSGAGVVSTPASTAPAASQ